MNIKIIHFAIFFIGYPFCLIAQNVPTSSILPSATNVRTLPAPYSGTPKNFLRTFTPVVPISDTSVINMSSVIENVQTTTNYLDAYGRSLESISKQYSPAKKDLVSVSNYDEFGRSQAVSYLPFTAISNNTDDGLFKTNPFQQDSAFYKGIFPNEQIIYSRTLYDSSPLNRVIKTLGVGNEWGGANRGKSYFQRSNKVSDSVKYWTLGVTTENELPSTNSYYIAGSLIVQEITDEQGKRSISYTDTKGKVILVKTQAISTPSSGNYGWFCTYYIYDETTNLRAIIPPNATEALRLNSWNFGSDSSRYRGLCYYYFYDNRGRQIMKSIPGKGKIYLAYDLLDRAVLTQDPNQRDSGKWAFVAYDEQSRPFNTGIISIALSKDSVQAQAARSRSYPTLSGSYVIMKENYYDNYDWVAGTGGAVNANLITTNINSTNFYTSYNTSPAYAQELSKTERIRTFVTGSKTLVLGTSTYLYSLLIYDNFGKVIQTQQNNISGGTDVTTVQHNFQGNIVRSHVQHIKSGVNAQAHTVLNKFSYDHAGRMISLTKSIDGKSDKTIVTNSYNEIGQIRNKVLGTQLEIQRYSYDIRGEYTGINSGYIDTANSVSAWFGESVFYGHGFTDSLFDGKISGTKWKNGGDRVARSYGYTYDIGGRLLKGDFTQQNEGSSSWTQNQVDYSISNLNYDFGGNILTMKQKGLLIGSNATIDSLTYTYFTNSNRLQKITDGVTSPLGMGDFVDSTNTNDDYSYDSNGNIVKDYNRHMYVSSGNGTYFNSLDKPDSIVIAGKSSTYYTYDASGTLLQKVLKDYANNSQKTYLYICGFMYQNDTLQYALTEEGRARFKDSTDIFYDYFIKDRMGNIRTVLTDESKLDIYPIATMDSTSAIKTIENAFYANLDPTRILKPTGYPTDPFSVPNSNNQVARVGGSGRGSRTIGPSMILKVMAGDSFNVRVSNYYESNSDGESYSDSPLSDIVTSLIEGLTGSTALNTHGATSTELEEGGAFLNISDFLDSQAPYSGGTVPKAFLNWVLFDEQFKYVSTGSGFEQVGAANTLNSITKTNMPIGKSGYLYIYVSNESTDQFVYFDNLQVSHKRGPLLETNEFYPYGLQMKNISYKAAGIMQTRYKFNGGSELEDEGELNYYSTFYRKYDAQIGRFTGIDIYAEKFTAINPYQFGGNNPVMLNDPSGALMTTEQFKQVRDYNKLSMEDKLIVGDWNDMPILEPGAWGGGGSGGDAGAGGGGEDDKKDDTQQVAAIPGGYTLTGNAAVQAFAIYQSSGVTGSVGIITFAGETQFGDAMKLLVPSAIHETIPAGPGQGGYADFEKALKNISDKSPDGIGFLAIFSHGGVDHNRSRSTFNEGMIFANSSIHPTAANIYTSDMVKLGQAVKKGEIRFAAFALVYMGACNGATNYKNGKSFAMELSRAIGGHTVYAVDGNEMTRFKKSNTVFTPECNRWQCGVLMRNTATPQRDYKTRARDQIINPSQLANWYLTQ